MGEVARLDLDDEALLAAYARHEARAEAEHATDVYPHIVARAFHGIGEELGTYVGDSDAQALAGSVGDWPAFPDSQDALVALGERYKLIILSNVDRNSFAGATRRLDVTFAGIVTAQDVGSYKPSRRNFDALKAEAARLGVREGKLLHVAQSLYHDHVPARQVGLARGVDQPATGPSRLGCDTGAARGRAARLGVPVDAGIRRCGHRRRRRRLSSPLAVAGSAHGADPARHQPADSEGDRRQRDRHEQRVLRCDEMPPVATATRDPPSSSLILPKNCVASTATPREGGAELVQRLRQSTRAADFVLADLAHDDAEQGHWVVMQVSRPECR